MVVYRWQKFITRRLSLQKQLFFFSSRRRHTRFDCDWSSDVCSSDLVPGTAKTLLVRTLALVLDVKFQRIQFTPDLMPADITGVTLLSGAREFTFRPGPIFADLVLADEINRAPAKTQAALLEAMQERTVTVDGTGHPLSATFTVTVR